MKKMIKGLIAIIFCILLLGCTSKSNPDNYKSYVILNVRDNIADTVRCFDYEILYKDYSGIVLFYLSDKNPSAIYTFDYDFPIIIKEVSK